MKGNWDLKLFLLFFLLLLLLCLQLQVLPAEGHEGSDSGMQLLDAQAYPLPLQALHPAVQPVLHHSSWPQAQVPPQHGVAGKVLLHRDLPSAGSVTWATRHPRGGRQRRSVVSGDIQRLWPGGSVAHSWWRSVFLPDRSCFVCFFFLTRFCCVRRSCSCCATFLMSLTSASSRQARKAPPRAEWSPSTSKTARTWYSCFICWFSCGQWTRIDPSDPLSISTEPFTPFCQLPVRSQNHLVYVHVYSPETHNGFWPIKVDALLFSDTHLTTSLFKATFPSNPSTSSFVMQ